MKLTLDQLARAIGDSRAEFYSFYAPSWAKPAALDAWRRELAGRTSEPAAAATVHPLPRRTCQPGAARLPHAA